MKKAFFFLVFVLLSTNYFASDKLEDGFYDLSIYNYFGAKEKFEKAMKKQACGASFGLSKIYENDKNPFYNLDSARVYALKSEDAWMSTKEKERIAISAFHIDSISIQTQLNNVAEKALAYFVEQNSIEGFEYFIKNYSYSPLRSKATQYKNELVYTEVLAINTASSYKEFMNFYPNAQQYDDAKQRYDLSVFEESASLSKIEDIELFIKDFPDSPYLSQAQDNLYTLSTQSGSLNEYISFIQKYPDNPNVEACWENIYKIETQKISPEVLIDFLMVYTDYPMRDELQIELANLLKLLIPATMNSNWGFIDSDGNWILRPIYDSCEPFKEGMSLISKGDKFGFINTRGVEVILAEYEDAESFKNGIAITFDGEKYGAVNRFGDHVIKSEYEDIGEFVGGIAYASKNGKYGYIDENAYVIIPFIYDQAFSFENDKALAKQNGKFGIIDVKNKWLIPFEFDWIEPHFNDSIIKVKKGDKYGIITFLLDTILPFEYDHIGRIDQEIILIVKENKVGYINQKGEILIPMIYETDPFILDWGEFDNHFARIRIKSKMGIIDTNGTRIVPAIFQEIGEYDGQLYPVKKNGKWGFADDKIKLIIGYRYQNVYPFEGEYARAMKSNKWGVIDRTGKVVVPFEYDKIIPSGGVYITKGDTAYGMMDYETNIILEPVFDQIKYNDLGYFLLRLNGKNAYLDIHRRKVFWKEVGFSMP